MKILFTRFPLESAMGGAEIQTLSLMKGLHDRGHEISFLGSCPVLLKKMADGGLRMAGLNIGKPPVTKWGALSFLWRQKNMKKLITQSLATRNPQPETVVMLSLSEKLLLTEDLAKRGIRVFWLEHDRVGRWLSKNPWLPLLRRQSKYATTICVSEVSKKMYVDLGWNERQIVVIPNGIDLTRFSSSLRPLRGLPPTSGGGGGTEGGGGKLRVACVSRLSQEKGVDVLIQAASTIPEIDLSIVGTGTEEAYLRKMIEVIHDREHSDTPRLRIVPRVENLGEFYASLDVLVLPSRENDPFGLVAAEAMSLGVPVIVTSACGIADYVRNGEDALVIAPNSEKSLTDALKKMLDPNLRARIGSQGKRIAHERFGLSHMIDRYEALFAKK